MNDTSHDKTRKPRVAVVFGGRSSEHGISCVTAGSVLAAIDRDAYDVVPVGIATDGRWVLEVDEPTRLAIRGSDLPEVDAERSPVALMGATSGTELVVTDPTSVPSVIGEVDVVITPSGQAVREISSASSALNALGRARSVEPVSVSRLRMISAMSIVALRPPSTAMVTWRPSSARHARLRGT